MRARARLYRAKTTSSNTFIYGHYFYSELKNKHYIIGESIDYGWQQVEIKVETLGQSTGLVDRDGVEIFEGDIMKGVFYGYPLPVQDKIFSIYWDRYAAGFQSNAYDVEQSRVVGNIYDNSKLLD